MEKIWETASSHCFQIPLRFGTFLNNFHFELEKVEESSFLLLVGDIDKHLPQRYTIMLPFWNPGSQFKLFLKHNATHEA